MKTKQIPDALISCFEDLSIVSQRYSNAFKADDVNDKLIEELQGDLKSFYKRLVVEVALPTATMQMTASNTLTQIIHSPKNAKIDYELMESVLDNLADITMNSILNNVEQPI